MESVKEFRLGEALTVLGLEDQFLSNGELQKFPLVQRGELANGIIDEKLKRGRWQGVIQMIFGGLGKADALYDGDMGQLRERIATSAASKGEGIKESTIGILGKREEYDLILRIMEAYPKSSLSSLEVLRSHIPQAFFKGEGDGEGEERGRRLDELLAKKAMAEENYNSALHYYNGAGNVEGIEKASDLVLEKGDIHYPEEYPEKIALSNPQKKESRLKKMVLSFSRPEGLSPVSAFKMFKKYNVKLSKKEEKSLYGATAEKTISCEIDRTPELNRDKNFLLLWAKKNAESNPSAALRIFKSSKYEGAEVVSCVRAGLAEDGWREYEKSRAIDAEEVPDDLLRKAYSGAPFKVQVKIAGQLKDSGMLQTLSRQALDKKNYQEAYHLYQRSGLDMDSEDATELKREMIEDSVKNHNGFVSLDKSDKSGNRMAFEALMSGSGKDSGLLPRAYEAARCSGDEKLVQKARERIVSLSPPWALRIFRDDPAGIEYTLCVVAKNTGSDAEKLKEIVGKYCKD